MKTVKTKNVQKFTIGMKKKLVVLFMLVLLAFAGLGARLISITTNNGKEYVVESGLQVGEEIISEGAGLVKEGAEVKGK